MLVALFLGNFFRKVWLWFGVLAASFPDFFNGVRAGKVQSFQLLEQQVLLVEYDFCLLSGHVFVNHGHEAVVDASDPDLAISCFGPLNGGWLDDQGLRFVPR